MIVGEAMREQRPPWTVKIAEGRGAGNFDLWFLMSEEKPLDVKDTEDAKRKASDVVVVGNPDSFRLLFKASSKSQGWMKSTKAMEVPDGCVVQVSTQQGINVAEALVFVPGVRIAADVNGGRKLVSH